MKMNKKNINEGYQPKMTKDYGYQPSKKRGFQPSSIEPKISKPVNPETGIKKLKDKAD